MAELADWKHLVRPRGPGIVMSTEGGGDRAADNIVDVSQAAEEIAAVQAQDRAAQEEMKAAEAIVRQSVKKPPKERKKMLRDLQVKWHPDRQYGDEESRRFAAELTAMVNEAVSVARKQSAAVEAKRKRGDAYEALMRQVHSKNAEKLAEAIDDAKASGVSDMEIASAERALARLRLADGRTAPTPDKGPQEGPPPPAVIPSEGLPIHGLPSLAFQSPSLAAIVDSCLRVGQNFLLGTAALAACIFVGGFVVGGGQSAEQQMAAMRRAAAQVAVERAVVEKTDAEYAERAARKRVAAARLAAEMAAAEQEAAESAEKLVEKRVVAAYAAEQQATEEVAAAESAVKAIAERKYE